MLTAGVPEMLTGGIEVTATAGMVWTLTVGVLTTSTFTCALAMLVVIKPAKSTSAVRNPQQLLQFMVFLLLSLSGILSLVR
jgi:hypothetical protein